MRPGIRHRWLSATPARRSRLTPFALLPTVGGAGPRAIGQESWGRGGRCPDFPGQRTTYQGGRLSPSPSGVSGSSGARPWRAAVRGGSGRAVGWGCCWGGGGGVGAGGAAGGGVLGGVFGVSFLRDRVDVVARVFQRGGGAGGIVHDPAETARQ